MLSCRCMVKTEHLITADEKVHGRYGRLDSEVGSYGRSYSDGTLHRILFNFINDPADIFSASNYLQTFMIADTATTLTENRKAEHLIVDDG